MCVTLVNECLDFSMNVLQHSLDRIERSGNRPHAYLQAILAPHRYSQARAVHPLLGDDRAEHLIHFLEFKVALIGRCVFGLAIACTLSGPDGAYGSRPDVRSPITVSSTSIPRSIRFTYCLTFPNAA